MQTESKPPCECATILPARTTLTLPTALSLYGLTHSELFTEALADTRCLVAWSARKIVITFRGTASVKNAKADLQVGNCVNNVVVGGSYAY